MFTTGKHVKLLAYSVMITAALFLIVTVAAPAMAATAPSTTWQQQFSSTNGDVNIRSVWQTSDGGYILGGVDHATADGNGKTCLIKTDAAGNKQWEQLYGDDETCTVYSVVQTSDGGYVFVADNGGANEAWLVKTDASGNKQWDVLSTNNDNRSLLYSVKQTSDGGYVACGFDELMIWFLKVDQNGNVQWNQKYDWDGDNYAYDIWPTSDGGYAVAGCFQDGDNPYELLKIDANGAIQWKQDYGVEDMYGVQQTRDGGYILSGDGVIVKTDAQGNKQWEYDDQSGSARLSSIQQTWDDGYVAVGNADNDNGDMTTFIVKLDSSGSLQWQRWLDGSHDYHVEVLPAVQQIGNGAFLVGASIDKDSTKQNFDGEFYNLSPDMVCLPNAQVSSSKDALVMDAGQAYKVTVVMTNNGTMPWTYQDGTVLIPTGGPDGDAALFGIKDNYTIPVGSIIRPGQSIKVDYSMTAPAMNGTYHPEVGMFWNDRGFFGEPANMTIFVVNGTPNPDQQANAATSVPTVQTTADTPTVQTTAGTPTASASAPSTTTETAPPLAYATGVPTEEQATSTPGQPTSTLPCGLALMPLLIVGVLTTGAYLRRKKGDQ